MALLHEILVFLLWHFLLFQTEALTENRQILKEKIRNENRDRWDKIIASQPIRVTQNIEQLDNDNVQEEEKNAIIAIMNAATNILPKFLKVFRTSGNNKPEYSTCTIPLYLVDLEKGIGIENSDLHIYVLTFDSYQSSTRAQTRICSIQSSQQGRRPNFITVEFNLASLYTNFHKSKNFQIQIETTLHEIIHGLGFSTHINQLVTDYSQFKENKKFVQENYLLKENYQNYQMIRNTYTLVINSSNVLSTVKKYYGCYELENNHFLGMQIENNGSESSKSHHWEDTILRGEIMGSSNFGTHSILSVFTIAFLQDTGYLANVNENIASPIYWGKNKGCDFLLKACKATQQFEEFTYSDQIEVRCSFQNDGFGYSNSTDISDQCEHVLVSHFMCADDTVLLDNPDFQDQIDNGLHYFGNKSKCFESSISKDREKNRSSIFWNSRCFQYECSSNSDSIIVTTSKQPSFTVLCGPDEQRKKKQVMSSEGDYLGELTCPSDYESFCDKSTECENHCSSNGICLRGMCHCSPGYAGRGCSLKCEEPNKYSYNDECVQICPGNLIVNPDNTCQESCPKGFYASLSDNNRVCTLCNFSCSECSGPSFNECSACSFLLFLEENMCVEKCSENRFGFNGICVDSCPTGTYEIEQNCVPCSPGCSKCTNGFSCTECEESNKYTLVNGKCCEYPCADCHVTDPRLCIACEGDLIFNKGSCVEECPYNTRLNPCQNCQKQCRTCFTINSCEECEKGYYLSDLDLCIK